MIFGWFPCLFKVVSWFFMVFSWITWCFKVVSRVLVGFPGFLDALASLDFNLSVGE